MRFHPNFVRAAQTMSHASGFASQRRAPKWQRRFLKLSSAASTAEALITIVKCRWHLGKRFQTDQI